MPRHVRDVKQRIRSVQVDKGAEVGERAYRAFHGLALGKLREALVGLRLGLFFKHRAAVHNRIRPARFAALEIELRDPHPYRLAYQLLHLCRVARAAARRRKKGPHADVDRKATLHHAGHDASDCALRLKRLLKRGVVLRDKPALPGQLVVAVEIAAFYRYPHHIAGLDHFFIRAKGTQRKSALRLVTDIQKHGLGRDRYNGGVDLL